jgi:thioesterase-3
MNSQIDLVVRSTDIDVNKHVNNAKYLEYLEWSREEWYACANLSYETFQQLGMHTVMVHVSINYRIECKQGDILTVTCVPLTIGNSSFVFAQELINQRQEVCLDAQVTCVTVHTDTRKSCTAPDELRKFFVNKSQSFTD